MVPYLFIIISQWSEKTNFYYVKGITNYRIQRTPNYQWVLFLGQKYELSIYYLFWPWVCILELRDLAWYKKQRHQKAISRVHFFITTTKQSLIWKFYCDSLKPCICPSNKSKNKTTYHLSTNKESKKFFAQTAHFNYYYNTWSKYTANVSPIESAGNPCVAKCSL